MSGRGGEDTQCHSLIRPAEEGYGGHGAAWVNEEVLFLGLLTPYLVPGTASDWSLHLQASLHPLNPKATL